MEFKPSSSLADKVIELNNSNLNEEQSVEIESDLLMIRPLGAGQEVGRSCVVLEFKGKKILLDCGIHPGLHGMDALPFVDLIEADEIDLLLISHFHLDHCGALPYMTEMVGYSGPIYMTAPTKAITPILLVSKLVK